mmetsp:Transcript_3840/g.12925  ORF Transcript_3840/g.12925 Transcript_3840/m.12925 type:complete len:207 (+) Transcript_3840:194-814(+)
MAAATSCRECPGRAISSLNTLDPAPPFPLLPPPLCAPALCTPPVTRANSDSKPSSILRAVAVGVLETRSGDGVRELLPPLCLNRPRPPRASETMACKSDISTTASLPLLPVLLLFPALPFASKTSLPTLVWPLAFFVRRAAPSSSSHPSPHDSFPHDSSSLVSFRCATLPFDEPTVVPSKEPFSDPPAPLTNKAVPRRCALGPIQP